MSEERHTQQEGVREQTLYEMMLHWRERLTLAAIRVVALVSIPLVAIAIVNSVRLGLLWLIPVYIGIVALTLYVAFSSGVTHQWRVGVFLSVLFALAFLNMRYTPIVGDDRFFVFVFIIFAAILLRPSYAHFWAAMALLVYGVFMVYFHIHPRLPSVDHVSSPSYALVHFAVLLVMSAGVIASLDFLFRRLVEAVSIARTSIEELQARRHEAEAAALRERALASMMERMVELSRTMYRIRDLESFSQEIPHRIVESFDLCRVRIFLANLSLDALQLLGDSEATSISPVEATFPLEMTTPEGRAILLGREVWETREGERCPLVWAVPMGVRGDVIGILLFVFPQAERPSEEMLRALRLLTDEVAYAIDTLRLVETLGTQMRQLTHLYGRTLLGGASKGDGYTFELGEIPQAEVERMMKMARRSGELQISHLEDGKGELLVMPLIWRELYLGSVALLAEHWDRQKLTSIREAGHRMAMVLENTYLLLDGRQRALREEALRSMGDRLWANLSLRAVMETGVRELGRLLGAQEVSLYIEPAALEEG